ncbi:hypothetical protein B0H19DRAFT_1073837 [Mycena capillaripes]|nr:hypothetical protein B0H19DRAFT_1073837 [Mycena capillaripes]
MYEMHTGSPDASTSQTSDRGLLFKLRSTPANAVLPGSSPSVMVGVPESASCWAINIRHGRHCVTLQQTLTGTALVLTFTDGSHRAPKQRLPRQAEFSRSESEGVKKQHFIPCLIGLAGRSRPPIPLFEFDDPSVNVSANAVPVKVCWRGDVVPAMPNVNFLAADGLGNADNHRQGRTYAQWNSLNFASRVRTVNLTAGIPGITQAPTRARYEAGEIEASQRGRILQGA